MISQQDKGLENLSKALRRQAEVGMAMQEEIAEHNGEPEELDSRIKVSLFSRPLFS